MFLFQTFFTINATLKFLYMITNSYLLQTLKKILLQIIFIQINLCKCLHSTGELLPVSLSTCTRSIQCCIMLHDIAVAEKVVSLGVVQNISANAV